MRRGPLASVFAVAFGAPLLLLVAGLTGAHRAEGLPQYAARAGRTCDNCHVDPTGWQDPPLLDRQCSLSCSGCHVDPTGGGMRTAAGYYYGIQTLSAVGATRRPWGDDTWYFMAEEWEDVSGGEADVSDTTAQPESQPTSRPSGSPTSQPTSQPSSGQGDGDGGDDGDDGGGGGGEPWLGNLAFGSPVTGSSRWALEQGRYGSLNADPLLAIGADFRLAFYFNNGNGEEPAGRGLIFPMQADVSLMLHPIEHLTFLVEGGGQSSRGRLGFGERVGTLEEADPFGLHETFVMTHEWPANAYMKVGRFVPPFGTRLDDHTAFVRRELGFDQGRPDSFVSGVELGAVTNYPYVNLAVFQLNAGQFDFFPKDTGTGVSATSGWRDLAWGAGASFYRSDSDQTGKRTMYGATWYFNPWRLVRNLPLTYLGELDFVHLNPGGGVRTVQQVAAFHELDVAFLAGMTLRLRYDFFDPDMDVVEDESHRLNIGFDVFPLRFTELQFVGRILFPHGGTSDGDFLAILRLWY